MATNFSSRLNRRVVEYQLDISNLLNKLEACLGVTLLDLLEAERSAALEDFLSPNADITELRATVAILDDLKATYKTLRGE